MAKKVLTIDFETHDPYIDRKLGAGWVYGINVKGSDFEVLGAAIRNYKGEVWYEADINRIKAEVASHDALVMHNASYDLGCLHYIAAECRDMLLFDTEVMSRLYDSSLISHSLDAISKKYLGYGKKNTALVDAVWNHDLYPWLKKEIAEKERAEKNGEVYVRSRPTEAKLEKFCKQNMKLIQETDLNAMAEYACADAEPTYRLFRFFLDKGLDINLAKKYSMCAHIVCDYRMRGVRVDLNRARQVHEELVPIIVDKYKKVYEIAGEEFNINSIKEVPRIFDKLKIKYPKNPVTGNPSITTPWMASRDEPICKAIVEARKAVKIDRDFIQKIIEMQEYTCPEAVPNGSFGRVYPELNLLRARTGRFSCVPMSTKALTRDGWKSYDELVIGEDILAYDMGTGTQKWTPLLDKNKLVKQKVGRLGNGNTSLRCTKDHKWVVLKGHDTVHNNKKYLAKAQLVEAGDIKKGHRVLMNSQYEGCVGANLEIFSTEKYATNYISIITRMTKSELDCFVLGFLLADGHNSSPTEVGSKRGWQWTQANTCTREQLLTATYLQHSGRIGVGRHSTRHKDTHTPTSRATLCHSPFCAVSDTWKEESVEDVWCPTTEYGTWVMREGDTIAITGNCTSPNIQQIPSRDEIYGPMCRSIFVPEEGQRWYSLDYSNQEGRLQVHYAAKLGCEGADELALAFNKDPRLDMHQKVADMCGISRTHAKTINLGLCLSGDTIIETIEGDKALSDIVVGDLVFTREGLYKKVFEKTERLACPYKVLTSTGKELVGSKEHRVLVTIPSKNGKPVAYEYLPIGELREGMYLTHNCQERANGKGVLGIVEAHALGFWIAEGHYNKHDYQMQACQNSNNFIEDMTKVFATIGIRRIGPDKSGKYLFRYPKELRDKYVNIGLDVSKKSRDKFIPRADYSTDEIRHILCGLYEGDGHISLRGRNRLSIVYTTVSEQLAKDVIYYLQRLGISAKEYRTSRFSSRGIIDVHVVGNISKQLFLARIPTAKNVEYAGKTQMTCERIVSISEAGSMKLYDIGVEGVHNFTANGLVVHNSYGMGMAKLGKQLGLNEKQAKLLREKYDELAPYLTELSKKCQEVAKKRGNVRTLGGRLSAIDKPMIIDGERRTFEYKALNKLIQGSAADQSIEAMIWAYKEGIPVLFPVHDQLCASLSDPKQAERLKYIMENAIKLDIPVVVDLDLEGGDSWEDAGH